MTRTMNDVKITSAERVVNADPATVFELIADPAQHPRWDGNDNLAEAVQVARVTGTGQKFVIRTTSDALRENTVTEFEEGRRIAWLPADVDAEPFGQLWRWEVEPGSEPGTSLVRHTYDWTGLPADAAPMRIERARNTTSEWLMKSIDRLAALAEQE